MVPNLAAARYKSVQINTGSPGQLLVLLYEGMFRFLAEASAAMRAGDRARAGGRIGKAHAILCELAVTLKPEHAPELCQNLRALYTYCMGQLIQANLRQDADIIDTVARILTPLREAWAQAVRSLAAPTGATGATADTSAAA